MTTWRDYPLWLRELKEPVPDEMKTPAETAAFELRQFAAAHPAAQTWQLIVDETMGDAFAVEQSEGRAEVRGGQSGTLYGTYAAIEAALLGRPLQEGLHRPDHPLRILECWDNMDGSVERGYAGRSIWFENNTFSYEPARIRRLGRLLASTGINVLCINNVNVHSPAEGLLDELLQETAAFADLLRPFGVRLMVSIDFSLPLRRGLAAADPLDPAVREWWKGFADRAWEKIPDLAGFLVKADSEHRPGPNAYGRTHAEGANMLAEAVSPHGGKIVWRAFVYNCLQDWRDTRTDRPAAAYDLYRPQDGAFHPDVILQVKYGPFDFQPREPVSPLLLSMEKTALACELQLAQEYTGQQIDLFAMPPMWRELLDQMPPRPLAALAAVSNLGRDACWCGHPFAALNLYAFGRFAWDRNACPGQVIRDWIRLTYALDREQEEQLLGVLENSRSVYEQYTAPLGLCWMVQPETHYGPSPYGYEFMVWGTYNRADRDAAGIDRTASGTGHVLQFPPEMAARYSDPLTCPDELLLYFHRLPYTFRMRDGRTLIQRIYDDHFEGFCRTQEMADILRGLDLPLPDSEEVHGRMEKQLRNAREWRDVINTFFHRLSGIPDEKGRIIYP